MLSGAPARIARSGAAGSALVLSTDRTGPWNAPRARLAAICAPTSVLAPITATERGRNSDSVLKRPGGLRGGTVMLSSCHDTTQHKCAPRRRCKRRHCRGGDLHGSRSRGALAVCRSVYFGNRTCVATSGVSQFPGVGAMNRYRSDRVRLEKALPLPLREGV